MASIRFCDLPIGATFRFASEATMRYCGMKTGPWRKLSSRRYEHIYDGMVCRVGDWKYSCVIEEENKNGTVN